MQRYMHAWVSKLSQTPSEAMTTLPLVPAGMSTCHDTVVIGRRAQIWSRLLQITHVNNRLSVSAVRLWAATAQHTPLDRLTHA